MSFLYRKIYADLVTSQGDVMVLYLTWLSAWGLRQARAAVELYRCDGRRTVWPVRGCPAEPGPGELAGAWRAELDTPAGTVRLRFTDGAPGWTPPGPPPHERLDWRVLTLRCSVTAELPPDMAPLEGLGYVDRVEMRVPPRALGLSRLTWGRAHGPCDATVFVHTTDGAGREWTRAATWREGAPLRDADPGAVRALAVTPGRGRVLHQGPALDAARFPVRWSRALARWLAGPIEESRILAVSPQQRLLYEHVTFGRRS